MTPTQRSLVITGFVLGIGVIAATAVTAGHLSSAEPRHTMSGSFTLANVSSACDPPGAAGAYDDISEGVAVTVYDAEGSIAGVGSLGEMLWNPSVAADFGDCVFPFDVDRLKRSSAYQVEVGHRGRVTVSRDEVGSVALGLD